MNKTETTTITPIEDTHQASGSLQTHRLLGFSSEHLSRRRFAAALGALVG